MKLPRLILPPKPWTEATIMQLVKLLSERDDEIRRTVNYNEQHGASQAHVAMGF